MRSSFASSVRWHERARNTSRARTLELGREQFRILAVTSARMISAGPSEVASSSVDDKIISRSETDPQTQHEVLCARRFAV